MCEKIIKLIAVFVTKGYVCIGKHSESRLTEKMTTESAWDILSFGPDRSRQRHENRAQYNGFCCLSGAAENLVKNMVFASLFADG